MAGDSPAAVIVDEEGNQVAVLNRGDSYILRMSDPAQLEVMQQILIELKRLNQFMEAMTDEKFSPDDVR